MKRTIAAVLSVFLGSLPGCGEASKAMDAGDRIVAALEKSFEKNGRWPGSLEELVPEYLSRGALQLEDWEWTYERLDPADRRLTIDSYGVGEGQRPELLDEAVTAYFLYLADGEIIERKVFSDGNAMTLERLEEVDWREAKDIEAIWDALGEPESRETVIDEQWTLKARRAEDGYEIIRLSSGTFPTVFRKMSEAKVKPQRGWIVPAD